MQLFVQCTNICTMYNFMYNVKLYVQYNSTILYIYTTHCPKNNLNIGIKTKSDTTGAQRHIQWYTVCLVSGPDVQACNQKSDICMYTVATAAAIAGLGFKRRFRLLL